VFILVIMICFALNDVQAAHKQDYGKRSAIDFCRDNFLSFQTLETVEGLTLQYLESLQEVGTSCYRA